MTFLSKINKESSRCLIKLKFLNKNFFSWKIKETFYDRHTCRFPKYFLLAPSKNTNDVSQLKGGSTRIRHEQCSTRKAPEKFHRLSRVNKKLNGETTHRSRQPPRVTALADRRRMQERRLREYIKRNPIYFPPPHHPHPRSTLLSLAKKYSRRRNRILQTSIRCRFLFLLIERPERERENPRREKTGEWMTG